MTDDSDSLSSFAENRIKSLELELSNTKEQLHFLQQSNDNLRRSSISLLSENEQAQESISNKLLRQIDQLKRDREQVCQQVEQEEEFMMSAMQRRLEELQREKIAMENALEQEQEFIVNRLQKQLDEYRKNSIISHNNSIICNHGEGGIGSEADILNSIPNTGNHPFHSSPLHSQPLNQVSIPTPVPVPSSSHHSSPPIKGIGNQGIGNGNGNINSSSNCLTSSPSQSPCPNSSICPLPSSPSPSQSFATLPPIFHHSPQFGGGMGMGGAGNSNGNRERERELQRIIKSLQEENQQLLFANLNLAQRLRRYTTLTESNQIISTLSPSMPTCSSSPSASGTSLHYPSPTHNLSHKSGSISDLRHNVSFLHSNHNHHATAIISNGTCNVNGNGNNVKEIVGSTSSDGSCMNKCLDGDSELNK